MCAIRPTPPGRACRPERAPNFDKASTLERLEPTLDFVEVALQASAAAVAQMGDRLAHHPRMIDVLNHHVVRSAAEQQSGRVCRANEPRGSSPWHAGMAGQPRALPP